MENSRNCYSLNHANSVSATLEGGDEASTRGGHAMHGEQQKLILPKPRNVNFFVFFFGRGGGEWEVNRKWTYL